MSDYPACDFCGVCEHCPMHDCRCYMDCQVCGAPIYFDQPICLSSACTENWDLGCPPNCISPFCACPGND